MSIPTTSTAGKTPGFDTPCPFVPEGATEWEAQEIIRRWRGALRALDSLNNGMADDGDRLLRRGKYAVSPEDDVQYDHRLQGGGITYYAMQAEAEMVALARVLDGVVHRQAMMERTADAAEANVDDH